MSSKASGIAGVRARTVAPISSVHIPATLTPVCLVTTILYLKLGNLHVVVAQY
ncbi:hypothetical protein BOTBODRAFT_522376 [Botryobasidium botryosum FD-172 SS1]|uniref:Uncharacterized protein n=1 Tax=Botryobasidium botryosum (strain FD-172 SS1) TaxID=930990 RepID=A0A067MDG1_BOTB1|nr:hypothetical protein BOTBODRAFT_522376 [Botryobasidium botryosum FD-172 SS1]